MSALFKDTIKEIGKKIKIFLSILFMALLGVGFFAGIRATTPDMQNTIDSYFSDLNVMDINVLSTAGFTLEDVDKIEDIQGIKEVELINTIDTLGDIDDKEYVFKTMTYNDTINKMVLSSGRLPENASECVLDEEIDGVELGDIVQLKTNDPRFIEKELKVVGFAKSPMYVSSDRGSSTLASGTIDYFMYINEENIRGEIYTDMYLTIDSNDNLFSDEYQNKVSEIKEEIEKENSNWYTFDLYDNAGFSSYADDTYRIENIAKIFPIIFFVVAILISLTSMTRMVEEQRVQIGTLKALGYTNRSIASKYIIYASLATLIGGFIGIIIGVNLIPRIIYMMYLSMYNTKDLIVGYNWAYSLFGLLVAYLCIIIAVIYACVKEMRNNPATLMRPKSPKSGKRILLEHIGFVWKRLNFTNKVTCRNMFRYKKRFLMTILGIMGCTALIFAGFGLKDSIGGMLPLQYGEVFKYDLQIVLSNDQEEENIDILDNHDDITEYDTVRMESSTIEFDEGSNEDTQIVVVDDDINDFINLGDTNFEQGVFLTRKVAKLLNIKEDDVITISNADGEKASVRVSKIVDNYLRHYIYMDKDLYVKLFKESPKYNVVLANTKETNDDEMTDLSTNLLESNLFSQVILTNDIASTLDDTLENMDYVVWILIISAGVLALTVLYNLSNVNISERIRELATIKVLGFYDREVYNYVSKENTVLTAIGIALGLGAGYFLTLIIVKTCELDILMFPTKIGIWCYIISIILTIVFTIIIQIINYFALKKIDMIESLKSIE